jgi:hypothetical protein
MVNLAVLRVTKVCAASGASGDSNTKEPSFTDGADPDDGIALGWQQQTRGLGRSPAPSRPLSASPGPFQAECDQQGQLIPAVNHPCRTAQESDISFPPIKELLSGRADVEPGTVAGIDESLSATLGAGCNRFSLEPSVTDGGDPDGEIATSQELQTCDLQRSPTPPSAPALAAAIVCLAGASPDGAGPADSRQQCFGRGGAGIRSSGHHMRQA